MRQGIANHLGAAKHQQACQAQAANAFFPVFAQRADTLQKLGQGQITPHMPRLHRSKPIAVGRHRIHIEVVEVETPEHPFVARILHPLRQHPAHGFIVCKVIAFVAAQIGAAKRVAAYMHGAVLSCGARHLDAQHGLAIDLDGHHVRLAQQVGADLFAVVQVVPQCLAYPLHIHQSHSREGAARLFLHPQQNHPSIGIGHGAVGLPDIVRYLATTITALCCLAFQIVGFSQAGQIKAG